MDIWSGALVAAALLLFFFAMRFRFVGRRGDGSKGKRSLGFGFGFVALVVWTLALSAVLDNLLDGFRLALGVVLILPVVDALAKPERASVFRATICLLIGVALGGPVVAGLWTKLNPPAAEAVIRDTKTHVGKLRELRANVVAHALKLETDGTALRNEIRRSGYSDFDKLARDETALKKLEELAEIDGLRAQALARQKKIDSSIAQIESDLRRLERQIAAEESMGSELSRDDIDALRTKIKADDVLEEVSVIEQIAEREELRELFEQDVAAGR